MRRMRWKVDILLRSKWSFEVHVSRKIWLHRSHARIYTLIDYRSRGQIYPRLAGATSQIADKNSLQQTLQAPAHQDEADAGSMDGTDSRTSKAGVKKTLPKKGLQSGECILSFPLPLSWPLARLSCRSAQAITMHAWAEGADELAALGDIPC